MPIHHGVTERHGGCTETVEDGPAAQGTRPAIPRSKPLQPEVQQRSALEQAGAEMPMHLDGWSAGDFGEGLVMQWHHLLRASSV